MKSLHILYISSFLKFAEISLEQTTCYKDIIPFANSLNERANQLLLRASTNKDIDRQKLQHDLFETGREYIKKFALKFKPDRCEGKIDESFHY